MKILATITLIAFALCAPRWSRAETTPAVNSEGSTAPGEAAAAAADPRAGRTIQQDGFTFVLRRSTRKETVDTEEYFLPNETPENWSQMVSYQRVQLPQPMGADLYVGWLKSQIEESSGSPRLRVVQSGKEASIFGVQYPKDGKADEQFALALVTVPDPRRPNELHLIQYSIQTQRVPVQDMELQVKRWRARFQSQAGGLSH